MQPPSIRHDMRVGFWISFQNAPLAQRSVGPSFVLQRKDIGTKGSATKKCLTIEVEQKLREPIFIRVQFLTPEDKSARLNKCYSNTDVYLCLSPPSPNIIESKKHKNNTQQSSITSEKTCEERIKTVSLPTSPSPSPNLKQQRDTYQSTFKKQNQKEKKKKDPSFQFPTHPHLPFPPSKPHMMSTIPLETHVITKSGHGDNGPRKNRELVICFWRTRDFRF